MKHKVTKFSFLALVVISASLCSAALFVDSLRHQDEPAAAALVSDLDVEANKRSSSASSRMSVPALAATMSLGLFGLFIKPE